MKSFGTIFLLSLFFLFQSCSNKDRECDGDCRDIYRSISVSVMNSEGQPVALDSYQVLELHTGRDLTINLNEEVLGYMRASGNYQLIGDKYVDDYSGRQVVINFTGFIDGEEIVSEDYRVGADCCHVYLVSGDLELVID